MELTCTPMKWLLAAVGPTERTRRARRKLSVQEPEVRVLTNVVFHLVKPLDALRDPALVAKVLPLVERASAPV